MRKIGFFINNFYHIYNRGVEKRDIFLDERDYWRFIYCLYESNNTKILNNAGHRFSSSISDHGPKFDLKDREPIVDIASLCLMPNHFHLLMTPKYDGAISDFMHRVGTSYTHYFNLKHERSGVLFQGTFKAKFVDNDSYLAHLVRYIHLNPTDLFAPSLKEGAVGDWKTIDTILTNYKWSTHHDYLGAGYFRDVINPNFMLLNYFQTPEIYRNFLAVQANISDTVVSHLAFD